ncbi:MAG: hypothetical protein D3916_08615 [Candidatus Electrothrix sp. MAN1_4]|nr:hypothetical protein [Candidatus Electrothrix sp. MAN1_4]
MEVYSRALSDTELQLLRLLTLFDFPVPEELLLQAGPKVGIDNPAIALQRLDNFGLLNYWSEKGLEEHVSCYGLAEKVVEPLGREDRNFLAKICAPLLWRIWFKDFLEEYAVPETETFKESIDFISTHHFPSKYKGEMPLSGEIDQRRIAALHRLCIRNSLVDWDELDFDADTFIGYLELSLSLHVFEKLRVSSSALEGLSIFQFIEIYKTFDEERGKFQALAKEYPQDIIRLMFSLFSGRGELLRNAYLLFLGELDKTVEDVFEKLADDKESQLKAAIKLAKTDEEKGHLFRDYADFLANQKQDYPAAEAMYERAVETDSNHADHLFRYAYFLHFLKNNYTSAEEMYERAVEADPNHALNLVNYAILLRDIKKDYIAAEVMYERAVEADPNHAGILGHYAIFLKNQKHDYPAAEAMYERAVEADPKHVNNLGSYAIFLADQKQDYPAAEAMYERAVEADPENAAFLNNYAIFLADRKEDYATANQMHQRAVDADPENAACLKNYAFFLANRKKDYAAADRMYQRAVEAAPENANCLGNYARLLFVRGEITKAIEMLERAELHQESGPTDLPVELAFYRYAHCQPQPISPLKQLLLDGVRSLDWNLEENVRRAEQDGHPNPALLTALAKVISGDESIETLERFKEWSVTEPNT